MKLQLLFCIMITILLIVYLRKTRMDMFEHLIDFSTELAQDSVNSFNDFEDMSGMTQELLNSVLKSQNEINKLMEHSKSKKPNRFSSSEVLNRVQSQKNQMKLLENDTMINQLNTFIDNLNDSNPSVAELIGKYSSK